MRGSLLALVLFSLGGIVRADPGETDLAAATVVIYNRAEPESAALARFYAEARRIPSDQLIGLECSSEEEISRQEYDTTIAEPLRKIFTDRHWWTLRVDRDEAPVVRRNRIRFVALIRGMPLKIRPAVDYPGDRAANNSATNQNQASVDSELAVLGLFSQGRS